jgi:hypothetical protein
MNRPRSFHSPVGALLFAVLLVSTLSARPPDSVRELAIHTHDQLSLSEVFAVQMPAGFIVAGGILLGPDKFAVWSPDADLRICEADVCHDIDLPGKPLAARVVSEGAGGSLEIFLVDPVRIATIRETVVAVSDISQGESPYAATWTPDGWLMAWRGPVDSAKTTLALLGHPARSLVNFGSVHLTPRRAGAIVQAVNPPFASWYVDASSIDHAAAWPDLSSWQPDPGPEPERSLVALPRLSVGHSTLLTVADLRSDQRWLLLADSLGRVQSERAIDAPIGFVASDDTHKLVLAVRQYGEDEVVVYRYTLGGSP